MVSSNLFIDVLIKDINGLIATAKNNFIRLDKKDLNWKADPSSWSIAECLQHLNLFCDELIPQMLAKIEEAEAKGGMEESVFHHTWVGVRLCRTADPNDLQNKSESLEKYVPKSIPENVVKVFIDNQKSLIKVFNRARKVSLSKVRFKSEHYRFFKVNLADYLCFMVMHSQKHLLQAMNILRDVNLEKSKHAL